MEVMGRASGRTGAGSRSSANRACKTLAKRVPWVAFRGGENRREPP